MTGRILHGRSCNTGAKHVPVAIKDAPMRQSLCDEAACDGTGLLGTRHEHGWTTPDHKNTVLSAVVGWLDYTGEAVNS